jgi:gliding motility-associated-like protein
MRKLYNLADKLKAYFFLSFSTLVVLGLQAQNHDSGQMTAQPYNFSTFYKSNQASSHPYWNKFNVVGFQEHPEFGLLPHDAPCENCVEDYSKRTRNERYFLDIQDTFVFYQQTGYGDLNYWNGQYWLSIDHRLKSNEIKGLHANYFANPLFLSPANKSIEIEHNGLLLKFNNWKLYKSIDDQKIFLFEANWSEFTSGDDGVFVKNIFPGIDAEFIVMRGTVKTNFIINNIEGIGVFDQLIFEDQFSLKNGQTTRTIAHENSASKEFIGSFSIYDDQMHELVQYGEGLAYSKADPKNNSTSLIYQLSDESVAILVPSVWLLEQLQNSPVVIDPIVTGTNTLAQASILGSMYNASCNFINSCNYNLTVAAPANAVFQNVTANFSYIAQGLCWMNEGAMRFTVGSCVSPNQAGFFWFCNQTGGGTCTGVNIPIYNDIAACLPAPACAPQNVTFTLQFFRSCWGTAGCNNNCIGAASAFSVTITGRTLEYSNQANPITVSATTICQGQSITASTTGLYGVAPYTYTWSFSPTGLPTIATGQSASINFPNTGTITLYSVVTDACGNQIIASRIITVNAAPIVVANATNLTICQGQSTTISGSGGGATYTWNNGLGNGISHVVSPSVTTTYLVSSTVSGCPGSATVTITVSPNVTPTFAAVGPFCSGANIPTLPTTSQNGITGTWSPAINNTATTTYTFTPTAGQCATTATRTVIINPNVTPTFAAAGPFCSGANIPALPTTSLNGFTGTWAPAINNTATTTYTFTPTAGQCATTTTLTITINPNITPTFAAVGPFCSGANIPALPTTSLNGYTGTWSPAINNTATTTYTFTPAAGQCATNTTLTITINTNITPTFAAVGPFCIGANIPALPTTSLNGFTGTWSPAINNSATTSYTFTPTAGQCALATTMTITVNPNITPTFAAVGPFCSGANIPALPTTSLNGFTGTWAPAINNTATTTYTFTPTAGQCATTTTLTITINPNITPTFAAVGPFCSGANIPALPTSSLNGFTGTWSPAINNTTTTTYTFTPTAGQCATTTNSSIVVNQPSQSITNYSICANNLPYQWNGLSIGSGGQHQVILTNAQGCDSVTVLNLTLIPVLTSTTNVTICANQAPYNWNGQSLSISGTTTLTLTSSSGCDSLATLNLTVNPMPQVSFTANSAASCAPVQVTFTNTSGISGTCQWNLGNGIVSNSCGTVTGIYENFGCYDVTLQVTNNFGCTSSLTQDDLICVDPEPIASFNVNPSTLSSFNPQAQFTNTSTGYSSQIWNFGDGSGGSNQNNPAHTYPEEAGQYYVTLVVSNSNGCLDSVTQLIIVENDVIYYIPNTFTPDDDLHNQTFRPIFTAGFDIYQYQMVIFNRWGEIIFESNNAEVGWDGTYGGNLCQDGIYLWQITYKELGKDKRNEIRGHVNLLK